MDPNTFNADLTPPIRRSMTMWVGEVRRLRVQISNQGDLLDVTGWSFDSTMRDGDDEWVTEFPVDPVDAESGVIFWDLDTTPLDTGIPVTGRADLVGYDDLGAPHVLVYLDPLVLLPLISRPESS